MSRRIQLEEATLAPDAAPGASIASTTSAEALSDGDALDKQTAAGAAEVDLVSLPVNRAAADLMLAMVKSFEQQAHDAETRPSGQ